MIQAYSIVMSNGVFERLSKPLQSTVHNATTHFGFDVEAAPIYIEMLMMAHSAVTKAGLASTEVVRLAANELRFIAEDFESLSMDGSDHLSPMQKMDIPFTISLLRTVMADEELCERIRAEVATHEDINVGNYNGPEEPMSGREAALGAIRGDYDNRPIDAADAVECDCENCRPSDIPPGSTIH